MKGRSLGLIACLFVFVLGARWAVVERYGMDLPEWDQWDAEGINMLVPWHQGQLTLGTLFQPQNEHRVVLTKLVNFDLTITNGQWDQRLENAVNSSIAALIAVSFFVWGTAFLGHRWHAPLFFLLAVMYGLPFASENVINGFHSQQLFLVGLSFGAIAGATADGERSGYRWPGIACMVLALLSMASGFFAAAIVLGALLLLGFRRERTWAAILPVIVISAILVAAACLTRVSVPYHEVLKAHSTAEFVSTFFQCVEWPVSGGNNAWLSVLLWLPWCWLVWRVLRGAGDTARGPGIAIACLGAWVILQILATAYARGAGGPAPAYRYVDNLIVGAISNALALGGIFEHGGLDRTVKRACTAIALLWLATFAAGCASQLWTVFRYQLPEGKAYRDQCVENVRGYLATGDEAYLRHPEIPYPGTDGFLARLQTPPLKELLPASVRDPLPLAASQNGGFVRIDSRRGEYSQSAAGGIGSPPSLPPECPPLSNAVFWSSFHASGSAGGQWESVALVAPQAGWLKFEVAGRPGENGSELEIRDAATGRILDSLRPGSRPGDSWRSAYVRAPAQPFVVVAQDSNPESWVAFSQPVEMGTLSYFAWRCVKNGLLLAELSAGAAFALILFHLLRS
jgi:hypothetical protein